MPQNTEHELAQRLILTYNELDQFIRRRLGKARKDGYAAQVMEYARRYRLGSDLDLLLLVGEIRNLIVHRRTKSIPQVAVPSEEVVRRLEAVRDRLMNPPKVLPKYQCKVESVQLSDDLASVLRKINERDYSQFPVFDGERFKGLLTENGITRWIAHHISGEFTLVDFEDIPVRSLFKEEETRPNHRFVPRSCTVEEVREMYREHPLLEAILITASGKRTEALMGIMTRWDMLTEK